MLMPPEVAVVAEPEAVVAERVWAVAGVAAAGAVDMAAAVFVLPVEVEVLAWEAAVWIKAPGQVRQPGETGLRKVQISYAIIQRANLCRLRRVS